MSYKIYHAEVIDIPPVKLETHDTFYEENENYDNTYLDEETGFRNDNSNEINDQTNVYDDKTNDIDDHANDYNDKTDDIDENANDYDDNVNDYDDKTDDIGQKYVYIIEDKDNNRYAVECSNVNNVINTIENNSVFHLDDIMVDNVVTVETSLVEQESDEEPTPKKKVKKVKKGPKEDISGYQSDIDVIFLSKEEQMKEIEDRKSSYNYISSYYKCEYCYKGFITEATYKNHMARHDPVSFQNYTLCQSQAIF